MKHNTFLSKAIQISCLTLLSLSLLSGCGNEPRARSVATDGSTSMEKVIGILGEAFQQREEGLTFTYNPTGSGSGITAVSEGRCDIGLSSRSLKKEETQSGLVETTLALDGIAIIVHPDNPVQDLDLETLSKLFTGEIQNWSAIGGTNAPVVPIGREAGSGTRDGFESITKTQDACKYRQELTATGDVITTVAGNPNAIGYTSLAAIKETVKALSINGIQASESTIKDGTYPVQRPFILVTQTAKPLTESAQAFMDFACSSEGADLIRQAGVVPAH